MNDSFRKDFEELMGFPPFEWQRCLFHDYFAKDNIPSALDIPTGLGKTSVMAIWYLALKAGAAVPRRLVYVVDRRVVVDQATTVANKLREKLEDFKLCVSTLRGQHVDNREWLTSPVVPAIVVGTVDMIGSRILFSGYGVSRKMRPYHAGLLGVDVLVVLDEAHLVLPFEELLKAIANGEKTFGPPEQKERDITSPFKLLSLSATGRNYGANGKEVFRLLPQHRKDEVVRKRLEASKKLIIQELDDEPKLVPKLVARAISLGNEPPARVLVYCDRRRDAVKVKEKIDQKFRKEKRKHVSELLVGGRRVFEREALSAWLKDQGFFGDVGGPPKHPTFLIATSAGEVGVDLDADHMVCDLVEWERMVQRFGRVNRLGNGDASIEVVAAPKKKRPSQRKKIEEWRKEWEELLACLCKPLNGLCNTGANTGAILDLRERADMQKAIELASTRSPLHPALTRALVDALSLTSLDKHTGRPEIQPWLRGWEDDPQPQTSVIWRKHLPIMHGNGIEPTKKEVEAFFEAAPPHASEKLETETYKVFDWLMERAKNTRKNQLRDGEDIIAYILSPAMDLRSTVDMKSLMLGVHKENEKVKEELAGATVVVNMFFGGLSEDGMLDAKAAISPRVIDDEEQQWLPQQSDGSPVVRFRVRSVTGEESVETTSGNWRKRLKFEAERTQEGEVIRWLLVEKWRDDAETEDDRSIGRLQELTEHQVWTEHKALALAKAIGLPNCYTKVLAMAARLHDEGKRHTLWQRSVKAPLNGKIYAKTDRSMNTKLLKGYRHEFGSLSYVLGDAEFKVLPPDLQDLVFHLVVAHHGWARPIISTSDGCGPPSVFEEQARNVALSFARLQKRWGPWGLAWWEALLRAADQQASYDNDALAKPSNCNALDGVST